MRLNLTTSDLSLVPGLDIAAASRQDIAPGSPPLDVLNARAPAAVTIAGVSARFGDIPALDDVSLEVRAGEVLCLLGPSGSGKSTLLRIVAGIMRPARGRITIEGIEVEGPGGSVEPERRRVGLVFQDSALFPHLSVAGNIAFGLRGSSRAGIDRTVNTLLERIGLRDYADRYPHMLSGGERQRVALARALAPNPRVLLMDEPFSSLDDRLRDRVRQETVALLRDARTTTIIVTHDPGEAVNVGDRIALLQRGRLVQCGSAEDLYARPTTAFAARFFSDVNELVGTCRCRRVDTPLGSFAAPHLPEQAAARVCIRPEHVRVSQGTTGIPAQVLTSEFRGEIDRLTLRVAGLTQPVSLRTFGRARLAPGASVYLEVESSGVVVVPDDESGTIEAGALLEITI